MKIVCIRSSLADALSKMQGAVGNSAISALEGILFSAGSGYLTLTAFNMELGITTAVSAQIEEDGEAVLNARTLLDIVRKCPGESISFEIDGKMNCTIKSGSAVFNIISLNAEEFPELPTVVNGNVVEITGKEIESMIKQTRFATAKNDDKPIYTGILFDVTETDLTLVGVDGYRLAIRKEKIASSDNCSFVVPEKSLSEMLKLIDNFDETVKITVDEKNAIFKVDNYMLITRLLEGTFINYEATVPKTGKIEVVADTKELLNMIDRVSLISNEKSKVYIKCSFAENKLVTGCESALGRSEDEIEIELKGEPVEIGFNSRFLLEALHVIEDDKIKITLQGPLQPMVISAIDGDSYTFLILPVRIKN